MNNDKIQTITGEALYAKYDNERVAIYYTGDNTCLDTFTVSEYNEILQDGYMKKGDKALRINW